MNADQLKEKWMQFKCELKQQYGNFIDDSAKQIEATTTRSSAQFSSGMARKMMRS